MRALRIGLTGGIASGKTTIASMFAELGVPVIDTDVIARELVVPGAPALGEIVGAFGGAVLDAGGALDRRRLRERVFTDPAARQRLEAILHPRIEAAALAACATAGGEYQLLVVPLLFESGFDRHVDRSLVVDCAEAVQRERLRRRDGASPAEIEGLLAAQLDRQGRLQRADDVIANDGTPEEARAQVRRLHERYRALAGQRSPARR